MTELSPIIPKGKRLGLRRRPALPGRPGAACRGGGPNRGHAAAAEPQDVSPAHPFEWLPQPEVVRAVLLGSG